MASRRRHPSRNPGLQAPASQPTRIPLSYQSSSSQFRTGHQPRFIQHGTSLSKTSLPSLPSVERKQQKRVGFTAMNTHRQGHRAALSHEFTLPMAPKSSLQTFGAGKQQSARLYSNKPKTLQSSQILIEQVALDPSPTLNLQMKQVAVHPPGVNPTIVELEHLEIAEKFHSIWDFGPKSPIRKPSVIRLLEKKETQPLINLHMVDEEDQDGGGLSPVQKTDFHTPRYTQNKYQQFGFEAATATNTLLKRESMKSQESIAEEKYRMSLKALQKKKQNFLITQMTNRKPRVSNTSLFPFQVAQSDVAETVRFRGSYKLNERDQKRELSQAGSRGPSIGISDVSSSSSETTKKAKGLSLGLKQQRDSEVIRNREQQKFDQMVTVVSERIRSRDEKEKQFKQNRKKLKRRDQFDVEYLDKQVSRSLISSQPDFIKKKFIKLTRRPMRRLGNTKEISSMGLLTEEDECTPLEGISKEALRKSTAGRSSLARLDTLKR